jgi:polysaccharide pyruvyl transferase WcaK-like protein
MARNGIAFNLSPVRDLTCESVEDKVRLREIALTIERVWEETGEEIYLLDINGHPLMGDTQLHIKLMAYLSSDIPVHIVEYDPNPLRLLQRLASYKAIVSMRLHGSILGFLAETPVLSLNYHSKCEGWCDQIDMPVCNRFDATNFSHESLACILLDGMQNGFLKPSVTTTQAAKLSIKNWRYSYEHLTVSNHSRYSAV